MNVSFSTLPAIGNTLQGSGTRPESLWDVNLATTTPHFTPFHALSPLLLLLFFKMEENLRQGDPRGKKKGKGIVFEYNVIGPVQ